MRKAQRGEATQWQIQGSNPGSQENLLTHPTGLINYVAPCMNPIISPTVIYLTFQGFKCSKCRHRHLSVSWNRS